MFEKALKTIVIAHEGQFRHDGITPYVIHPIMVANHVKKYTDDLDTILAAYLHDTIEDTTITHTDLYENFGKAVADLVLELTNEKTDSEISGIDKDLYIVSKMINMSDKALLVKLADIYDNTRTSLHRKNFLKRRLYMMQLLLKGRSRPFSESHLKLINSIEDLTLRSRNVPV